MQDLEDKPTIPRTLGIQVAQAKLGWTLATLAAGLHILSLARKKHYRDSDDSIDITNDV